MHSASGPGSTATRRAAALRPSKKSANSASGNGSTVGINKDTDAAGTDSTTGNASSTLAGAESSNQVSIL